MLLTAWTKDNAGDNTILQDKFGFNEGIYKYLGVGGDVVKGVKMGCLQMGERITSSEDVLHNKKQEKSHM